MVGKLFQTNRQEKKPGVAILKLDKIDFKTKGHKESLKGTE